MSSTWGVVAQIGFWGWMLGTVGYILTVFPHRGSFLIGASLRWGIPLLLCYLVWVVGMLNA
jgi:hypothetical protein